MSNNIAEYGHSAVRLMPNVWGKKSQRSKTASEAVKGIRSFLEDKRSEKVKLILEKYDQEIQLNEAKEGLNITYDLLVFFCLGVKMKPVPVELENFFLEMGYVIWKKNIFGEYEEYKKGEQNVPEF